MMCNLSERTEEPVRFRMNRTNGVATFQDMKEMTILPPSVVNRRDKRTPHKGVFVGTYRLKQRFGRNRTYCLRHDGPEHVLAFEPTHSGKGLVMPALETWENSAFVYDPKGEAWACTSEFRHHGLHQNIYMFDPAEPDTTKVAAFNPLAEVRLDTKEDIDDVQDISAALAEVKVLTGTHAQHDRSALATGIGRRTFCEGEAA